MRIILAIATLLAFAGPALAAKVTLKGDVTYRERIALPPGGTLSVSLVDLAAPDQPRVAAKAPIGSPGQVPLTFTLNFEENVIVPGHQYGLVAEISGEDALWFRNAAPYAIDPLAPAAPLLIVVNIVSGDETAATDPRHHLASRNHWRRTGGPWRHLVALHRLRHACRRPWRLQLVVRAGRGE
jgi:putative lipoprotein